MSFQFDKRDHSEDQKQDSNMSPAEKMGGVIAALGVFVTIIPLLGCSRFRRWVSSISPAVKAYPPFLDLPKPIHLHIPNPAISQKTLGIKLLNPVLTSLEDLGANSGANPAPIPNSLHTHNNHSDAELVRARSDTLLCSGDGIEAGGGRVPHVGESLAPRRPERAVTCPLQLR